MFDENSIRSAFGVQEGPSESIPTVVVTAATGSEFRYVATTVWVDEGALAVVDGELPVARWAPGFWVAAEVESHRIPPTESSPTP